MTMMDERENMPKAAPFSDTMTRKTRIRLIVTVFLGSAALPFAFYYFSSKFMAEPLREIELNLLTGSLTLIGVLLFGYPYLKGQFESIEGNALLILRYIILALLIKFSMEFMLQAVFIVFNIDVASTQNNEAIINLSRENFTRMLGLTVIIAPIVEEIFFRGCIFGGLYKYGRAAAYTVSVLSFALLHVASFMILEFSPSQLAQLIMYIPASAALAYCYEKSGNIWASIAMHSGINAFAMVVLNKMA